MMMVGGVVRHCAIKNGVRLAIWRARGRRIELRLTTQETKENGYYRAHAPQNTQTGRFF